MTAAPRYPGIRVTANGNQLVSYHTETRIADAGVFYPITPSTELGELYQQSYAEGRLNVFGGSSLAVEAEGEHAAQGGAIAHSVCGKRVVNFTSGQGVLYGVEQYYHAPGKCSTMVLEVVARALTKHALNVHCGHDDVYGALDTGWIILFGKDAQQTADQALILRRVTELSLTPGMNCQDGFLTSHLERTFYRHESELIRLFLGAPDDIIDCPTESQRILFGPKRRRVPRMIDLTNPVLLGPVQNQEHYMQGIAARRNNFTEPIPQFLEDAYAEFGKLTGRYYGMLTAYKAADADTVFVSLGSAAENIEAAVDYLRERRGAKVGSIHLNVIRPFPEAAVIKALAGKKNVIVLERTDEAMAGDNPMGRDIRTALNKALQTGDRPATSGLPAITAEQMPRLFSGIYGCGSRDFRPEQVFGAYEFATGTRARKDGKLASDGTSFIVLGVDHPYEVKSDETPSLLPKGAVAVRFHSIGGWGAITTGKNLGAILGDLNDLLYERDKIVDELGNPKEIIHVSANPKYGSEKKGAPTAYFLVAAPERIRVNCDLRHVTVVLCCDPKAFTHTNPLAGMADGGCLVWESDETGDAAWERLPLWARKQVIDEENPRVHLAGVPNCARRDRPRRSSTSHAGERVSGRIFRGFAAAWRIRHNPGAVPRRGSQAVREEVWPARRSGREVEHGSHDAGLRTSPGDSRGRARSQRPILDCAVRHFCRRVTTTTAMAAITGCRSYPVPAGQAERTPVTRIATFDAEFRSGYGYNQPSYAAGFGRRHGRRHRRYRVEVRRPPGDSTLHPGKLHAMHGVHRRVSRYGAAQLFAGSGDDPAHCGHALRHRSGRAQEDAAISPRDREARASDDVRGGGQEFWNTAAANPPPDYGRGGRVLGRGQAPVLRHHRQSAHGLPEGECHLLDSGEKEARAPVASSPSSSPTCVKAAPPA